MPAVKRKKDLEPAEEKLSPQEKLKVARQALATALVERDAEIELVLTALIARENPLLVGPPGCGKSLLLDSLARWVECQPFDYLLTKFTDPMELFGPIDLGALKASEYRRNVDGFLPTATFVFLDEIWKGSSAILNTLLKVLNERVFSFGKQHISCPLILCVAASNEWPNDENGGKELGALFDRFLFRKTVAPVSKAGRKMLLAKALGGDKCQASFPCTISPAELKQASLESQALPWSQEAQNALLEILESLNKEGIFPGDRRSYKAVGAARAAAYLAGGTEVLPEHLEILSHVLWDDPTEQPGKCEKIVAKLANPLRVEIAGLEQQLVDAEEKADDRLKGVGSAAEREGVIREVMSKIKQIGEDLKLRAQCDYRDRVIAFAREEYREWSYRLINAERG